jgi:hypothetical protein
MRKMLLVGSSLAIAAAALPAAAEAPWVPRVPVPDACRTWARDLDNAQAPRQRASAELSLASCWASARLDAAELPGGEGTIATLGAAIEPALAILDDVSMSREPTSQILAAEARGALYAAVIVRARVADRGLEHALAPWQDAASRAYSSALALARLHPGAVIADPIVASAVQRSRGELTRPAVAAR